MEAMAVCMGHPDLDFGGYLREQGRTLIYAEDGSWAEYVCVYDALDAAGVEFAINWPEFYWCGAEHDVPNWVADSVKAYTGR